MVSFNATLADPSSSGTGILPFANVTITDSTGGFLRQITLHTSTGVFGRPASTGINPITYTIDGQTFSEGSGGGYSLWLNSPAASVGFQVSGFGSSTLTIRANSNSFTGPTNVKHFTADMIESFLEQIILLGSNDTERSITGTIRDTSGPALNASIFNPAASSNVAPTLTTGTADLAVTDEDTTSSGTTVASLLSDQSFGDTDTGDAQGMAITGVTGNGTWQFSTNGTSGWTDFGAVSGASSLLLGSGTRVRYVPDAVDGETATFTFRGWDQTSGTASVNGFPLTASSASNGAATAFSSNSATASIVVSAIDDAPILTVTAGDPVHQAGTPSDLFNTVTADTVESGQVFSSMTLTVSNLVDGAGETLGLDGSVVALTDGNSVVTATNTLTVTVSITGTTATVSFSGATLSEAALQTLVDSLSYNNISATPTLTADRVVTITELVDSGTSTGSNDNTAALNLASSIAVSEQASLIVTTTADVVDAFDGVTSLREAVALANSNVDDSAITFDATVFAGGGVITLAGTDLDITTAMSISGDIDGDAKADVTIDGDDASRIFDFNLSGDASLEALILTGGNATSDGGAVLIQNGDVTITETTIRDNFSAGGGGGIFAATGTSLTLQNSAIVGNTAINHAGGISLHNATANISNTTISGNENTGGAIYLGSGIGNDGSNLTLTNSTITGNIGVGYYNITGTETFKNNIILGNTGANVGGATLDATNIISGAAADVFAALDGNGGGLLADNGGPVQTAALRQDAANPALDVGPNTLALLLDADGNERIVDLPGVGSAGANSIDAGAVELQALGHLTVTLASPQIKEIDGAGATTGTVTRSGDTSTALVVTLLSSDLTEATVPATVTIAIGDTSASFAIAAVDDGVTDGPQIVTITASGAAINSGTVTLEVIENLPPTLTLDPATFELPEDADVSVRIKLADVVISDDGIGSNILSLHGADSGNFELDGLELFLKAGAVLDFEREFELDVFVDVDDPTLGSGRDDRAEFRLTLTDVNEPPSLAADNVVPELAEDADTSLAIKLADLVISDDALGSETLSLTGANAGLFSLLGTELFLKAGTLLDFETDPSLSVTVSVDDTSVGATPDDSIDLTFQIADINEAPTIEVVYANSGIPETSYLGTLAKVADIVIHDDALGEETLALIGPNRFFFELRGTELFVRGGQALDFETQHPYTVDITVDDPTLGSGVEDTVTATLQILDVNEAPALALANVVAALAEDTDTTARLRIADIVL
ncbi:MAG: right-handed parallel beta-helix repeat-containing protein, partial [Rhodobacteraceae bacterium]|nr:right-handed parallel beta-helix repeat-containing protein [Paracoccaceae bacterium]